MLLIIKNTFKKVKILETFMTSTILSNSSIILLIYLVQIYTYFWTRDFKTADCFNVNFKNIQKLDL